MGELLAHDGWQLGILDRDPGRLRSTARHLEGLGAERVQTYAADVTDEAAFTTAVADFAGRADGLDFMVNNAGVAVAGSIDATPAADWRWALEINVVGVAIGCRAALPYLRKSESAGILNIASAAAFAAPAQTARVQRLEVGRGRADRDRWRRELAGTSVRAHVAMPGFFPTRLLDGARAAGCDARRAAADEREPLHGRARRGRHAGGVRGGTALHRAAG